ncbi:MAG: hypothetical protein A3G81_22830 [Betaproteobacteria bacterium RIFCSPLOWO2_12_FULL_65_14]|nr:MAG: hypothetical protein A3G81_22830 [Betaproteobacteria bacterium RIFCSPLOWO2_12_FULL_65_14]
MHTALRLRGLLRDLRLIEVVALALRIDARKTLPALQVAEVILRARAILLLRLRRLLVLGQLVAILGRLLGFLGGIGLGRLRRRSGVAFTPGGGASPYCVLPFLSVHLYCCARAVVAKAQASAKRSVLFMRTSIDLRGKGVKPRSRIMPLCVKDFSCG